MNQDFVLDVTINKNMNEKIPDFETDINNIPISFDGNPNLKKARVSLPFSKEHVEEYIKCAQDWQYFAETYYHILDIDKGMIVPKLRDYQKNLINSFIDNRYTIVLSSRQMGKSTSFEIFVCWYILFNEDKTVAILANKAEQSRDLLRKIKLAYEMLPKWLQQGVILWNAGSIKLENGCMVIASSTSSTAIRGRSISVLIIDEFAFIPNNIFEDFYSSVYPTITAGKDSKVIFVSTPNGLNHFYKFWNDAEEGRNKFKPIRVDWYEHPDRDERWKEETIANIGLVRFRSEFGNEFFGSVYTLIDPDKIKSLRYKEPLNHTILHKKIGKSFSRFLSIFEEPKPGHEYVIGVDSAKMTEDNAGDALGIQVLDITRFPIKQVATFFAKEGISYLRCPEIIYEIGNYYNKAIAFIENNEIGQEVANIVHFDLEYENVFFEKGNLPGFRTTKKTKRLGCSNLKLLIENNKLILNDFETISQLSTFVKSKESYKAESGYQDDLVMALVSSLYFLTAKNVDIGNDEINLKNVLIETKQEIEDNEDSPMFGFLPSDEYEKIDDIDW